MTVMVTGASGFLGRALVPVLLRSSPEIRCAVGRAEAAESLRDLGAKVTVGRLDDADLLTEVLRGIETVIHLVGGPNQPTEEALLDANHGSTLICTRAAQAAGVKRFLLLSVPGAAIDAAHPYLRAKGLAEEVVANSGFEHLILRSTHAYGLGGFWFTALVQGTLASPPLVVGDGAQELAPVAATDVAAVLVAADDRPEPLVGTFGLEGPDVTTTGALLRRLAGPAVQPEHVSGEDAAARLTTLLGIPVTRAAAEWLAMPSRADAPDAASLLGVRRTPLAEGLRDTLAKSASGAG